MTDKLLFPSGGYRKLKSFQISQLVYDITVRFVELYVDKYSRTCDQMTQAARSGVQNIAEGSVAAATSKKTELKLTNVARASLEELKLDYEDFLRQRQLPIWEHGDPRRELVVKARCSTLQEFQKLVNGQSGLCGLSGQKQPRVVDIACPSRPTQSNMSTPSINASMALSSSSTTPERAANAALVLINVAISLLSRQIEQQAASFMNEGGFTERLYKERSKNR